MGDVGVLQPDMSPSLQAKLLAKIEKLNEVDEFKNDAEVRE